MAVAYLGEQLSPSIVSYREACSVPSAGDLMDVFPCSDEQATIVIGDVCGHDAQAREHARYLRLAVRALAGDHSPARLMESVNRAFCRRVRDVGDDRFASLFVARLAKGRLTYASAGHDLVLLMRAGGQHGHLEPTGGIVGINEIERYGERTLAVAPSDWLILVTDGITDARDARGAFFGTAGVVRNAMSAIAAGTDDPATHILEAARTHCGDLFIDAASVLYVRFS